jgi:hypothetical protein
MSIDGRPFRPILYCGIKDFEAAALDEKRVLRI